MKVVCKLCPDTITISIIYTYSRVSISESHIFGETLFKSRIRPLALALYPMLVLHLLPVEGRCPWI